MPEELINTYIASGSKAQNITTNKRDWVVQATSADDTITANGSDSINAGAGSDQITVNSDGATITSGAGEDFITVSETVNDITLSDLNSDDTLTISGTFEVGSAQIEDTLLVVTDKTGTRKIRLGDFDTAKSAKINSTTIGDWLTKSGIDFDNLTTKNYADDKVTSSSNTAEDDGGRIAIDPDYTPAPLTAEEKPAVEEKIDKSLGKLNGSSNTTGAISVNLANVDTSAEGNVVIDGATVGAVSSTFPNASTFTRNGLTIHLLGVTSDISGNTNNIVGKTLDELTDDQRTIVAGLFKWWGNECLKLNEESYDISFNSSTTMIKDIGLFFYDSNGTGNALATVWNSQRDYTDNTGDGFTTQLLLNVNMHYYNGISSDDMEGTSTVSGAGLLDRTLAHEFNHAVMAANVNYFSSLPKFIKEGMAELTHGIDDERGNVIFKIAYDAEQLAGSLDLANTGTGSQEIGDGYSGGYMFLRYFAKQAAEETLPAFGEITATVNLSRDGDYYISGNSTSEAASSSGNIKLGTVSNGVYTVANTGVHQVITNTNNLKIVGLTVNDTLIGGAGADIVELTEGSFLQTGAGNDSIKITGQYATIETGADSDTVNVVEGSHHSINLGDGNNLVSIQTEYSYYNTITAGDGNNTIYSDSSENGLMTTGAGDDSIYFGGKNNTVSTGAGDDTISFRYNGMNENWIDLGAGNDSIKFGGSLNTIFGGAGNDTYSQYSNSNGGNYFVYNSAFGNDFIVGFKSNDSILIPDTFTASQSGSTITVSKGDTVKGTINLNGYSNTVNVVSGKVQEETEATKEINNSTDGTDGILITGTADSDTITNSGTNVTISGAEGDDTIKNSGSNVVFQYTEGDGNDSIAGFNETSTLKIGDGTGTYSKETVDSDIIVTVGEGTVTLKDAASLSEVNIAGTEKNTLVITLTEDADTYSNAVDNATILALGGNDKITNKGANSLIEAGGGSDTVYNSNTNVTIDGGADNDYIQNSTKGINTSITAGDGNDRIYNYARLTTVDMGNGDDYIQNTATNVTIMAGYGNDSVYNYNDNSVSINLGDGNDSISNTGDNVTINGGAGNDYITVASGSNLTINGGDGADTVRNSGISSVIDGGAGNDYIYNYGASAIIYGGDGIDLIYNTGSNVSINGGAGDDSINLHNGAEVTVNVSDGNDTIYVNSSITSFNVEGFGVDDEIKLASAVDTLETLDSGIKVGSLTINGLSVTSTISGWSLSNNIAIYSTGGSGGVSLSANKKSVIYTTISEGKSLVTVSGVASTDGLDIDEANKVVTISDSALNGQTVTLSGEGYTLAKGTDVAEPSTTPADWKLDGTTATYNSESTTSGYTLEGNQLVYTPDKASEELAMLIGVKSLDGIKLEGNVVTISDSALNGQTVTLTGDGYTLAKGSDVAEPVTMAANWKLDGTTATYNSESTTAGYTLEGNQLVYTPDKPSEELAMLIGVKSLDGVKLEGNVVTISDSALTGQTVTLSGEGYTLALGEDVPASTKAEEANWSLVDKIATYEVSTTTAGYTLVDNQIVYVDDNEKETLIQLSGVASVPTLQGSNVKLTNKNFAGDVSVVKGANYSFELNKGTYSGKKFSGSTDADTISVKGTSLKIDGDAGDDSISISGGLRNTLNGGAGNDTLKGDKGNDFLNGDADNDILIGGAGNDTFAYSGGADLITDYTSKDKISLVGGLGDENFTVNDKDLVLNYGDNNSLTIQNGADKKITLVKDGKSTVNIYTEYGILSSTYKNMELSASTEKFNAAKYSKLVTISGAKAEGAIEIFGNKKANYIIANNNGATLNGGKGKDSLRGGTGADVFVYENKGGNDIIYNYDASDTISLVGGATTKDVKFRSNGDAIVKVGSNFITVKNASDKEITFVENGATKKFSNGIFTDETKTSATLPASFRGTFDLGSYGVTNADNSLSKKAVILQGSSSDNFLTGGKGREELHGNAGNDTLDGGKGNDLLWGGAGADTFIYKAGGGKDTIIDYENGELISILDKKDNAGKFSKAIFSDNTLTLTIKGGGKVTLNNVSASTEFNINNETYRVRGNALIK